MTTDAPIRVEVQVDHESASLRYIVRAYQHGECIHEIRKYAGMKAGDEVFRSMAEWLGKQGLPVPDHYWQQTFPR